VTAGHQAYVVCPLIEESEKIQARSAVEEYDRLRTRFSRFALGLLHGQMPAKEREAGMAAFRVARSTSSRHDVIEVGVDVPNATVMVIMSADRFGVAQLHQLRGRGVGIGPVVLLSAGEAARRRASSGSSHRAHDRRVRVG